MTFESVRAYVQLASGLTDLTRARAMEAAQGLLSLPGAGLATGTKMASQASVLAEELLAAATANRSSLQMLVRSEVDGAMSRLGLVPVQQLEEAQAEAEKLRHEVDRLRSASTTSSAPATATRNAAAPRAAGRKAAGRKAAGRKAAGRKAAAPTAAASKPAVTKPAVTKPAVTKPAVASKTPAKKAPKAPARRVATKPAAVTTGTTARPSAVTTRVKPDGT